MPTFCGRSQKIGHLRPAGGANSERRASDILSDPEMMKQLEGSAKDLKEGRLIDLDRAF